jgi:hypothetical protein
MDIERYDGTKERRYYDHISDMMVDAEKEAAKPETKKLTLYFPKMRIPKTRKDRQRKEQGEPHA